MIQNPFEIILERSKKLEDERLRLEHSERYQRVKRKLEANFKISLEHQIHKHIDSEIAVEKERSLNVKIEKIREMKDEDEKFRLEEEIRISKKKLEDEFMQKVKENFKYENFSFLMKYDHYQTQNNILWNYKTVPVYVHVKPPKPTYLNLIF